MSFETKSVGMSVGSAEPSGALSVFKRGKNLEVLAPAGGFDTVIAAVRSGADAVYFGAPSFNARRNAKNFTREEMAEAISFCKVRGVKTYLTLNTLVSDREMEQALLEAKFAFDSGIDAVIVQDLGLARLLKEQIPSLPLHASTQMSVHSHDALPVLKKLGFVRVVPAREMDKKALTSFCKKAQELGIEVEVFVHGALCMCLSGQCYLSAMLGGRSGNRGLCAQPCRLAFSVENGTGHDLSLKDMSFLSHIEELREMGVCSLKIEGRMKRPEYVAAAVSVARATVDGQEAEQSTKDLLSGIFSRSGHTDGYFTAKYDDMFGIRTNSDEKMTAELINTAHELYRRDRQSVPVEMELKVKENKPTTLMLRDFDGNEVKALGDVPQQAQTKAITEQDVKEKLSKLGGTCYYLQDFKAEIDGGLFLGAGSLNALRRECVELLDKKRSIVLRQSNEVSVPSVKDKRSIGTKPQLVAFFKTCEQIPDDLTGVGAVVLPVETDFSKVNLPKNISVLADLPRGVMHFTEKYRADLVKAKQNGVKAVVVGNIAGITLTNEVDLFAVGGLGLNVFNSHSLNVLADLGLKGAIASFELTADAIRELKSEIPVGTIVYGRLPLMIFKNCPGKNGGGCKNCDGKTTLTDRKQMEFPVFCRGEFSEMFNSKVLWNFDRSLDFGAGFKVLYFTDESKERCQEVINSAIFNKSPDCDYTRGLYYRGVQ